MRNDKKMLELLHKIFRNDTITKEIIRVTGSKLDELELEIDDIERQNFVDSATWGINIFEKELDLKTLISKPISERRAVVSAKWRGVGALTLKLIKQTIDAYTNADADVKFTGTIDIEFNNNIGRPPNMEDVYRTVEDIKPAHLGVKYSFRFRTYFEVSRYRMEELNKYTYQEIREGKLPVYTTYEQLSAYTYEQLANYRNKELREKGVIVYTTYQQLRKYTYARLSKYTYKQIREGNFK